MHNLIMVCWNWTNNVVDGAHCIACNWVCDRG